MSRLIKKFPVFFCGLLGVALLGANFYGLFVGDAVWPRPDTIIQSKNFTRFKTSDAIPARQANESASAYAIRMTDFVHSHTSHYFYDNNTLTNIDVVTTPFSWCWPLWLLGFKSALGGKTFVVEFCKAERGLARGYGYCSQRSLILQDILRREGIPARATKLFGHVVCLAWDNGGEMVLDPDNGYALRKSLEEIRKNPAVIEKFHTASEYAELESIYRSGRWNERGNMEYDCLSEKELFWARVVQWTVPIILLMFCGFLSWPKRL